MIGGTRLIPLTQAQEGMRLAADARDAGGNPLLAEGAVLTGSMIASLRQRGVASLQIAAEEKLTEEQLAARRDEVIARVNAMFRKSAGDALTEKLRETLLEYRLEALR